MTYASIAEADRDNEVLMAWGQEEGSGANCNCALVALYFSDGSGVTPFGPVPSDISPRPTIANQGLFLRKRSKPVHHQLDVDRRHLGHRDQGRLSGVLLGF